MFYSTAKQYGIPRLQSVRPFFPSWFVTVVVVLVVVDDVVDDDRRHRME